VRKTTFLFGSAMLLVLAYAPAALAGGGFGGDPATGKISGPAVSATMVVDPTFGSPTLGDSAIRLAKGTAQSGSLFVNREATTGGGWVMGCDGVQGAAVPAVSANVLQLTQLRFVNNRMRAYVPAGILARLFAPLGITIDDVHKLPVITDVDSPICTMVVDTDGTTKYMLSFTAVIQFEDTIK
jgi:hypothetical protein